MVLQLCHNFSCFFFVTDYQVTESQRGRLFGPHLYNEVKKLVKFAHLYFSGFLIISMILNR